MPKATKFSTGVYTFTAFLLALGISAPVIANRENQAPYLRPYKDSLFNYSVTLDRDGAFEVKDFNELRDVNGRDSVPVKKAREEYVETSLIGSQRDRFITSGNVRVEFLEAGLAKDADFTVVFAHGGGGTKLLGMQDWTFGGNFNRLKFFAVNERGTYYSPTFTDFKKTGAAQINLMVGHIRKVSPRAKIVLACASSGGAICESAFLQPDTLSETSGFILMSTTVAPGILKSIGKNLGYRGAIMLMHGENDRLVNWEAHYNSFNVFRQNNPTYPVRYQLFKTGGHGTPIRMIDWREALNWIFKNS